MKKIMFNIFMFTAGAAVGSVVTWKLVKTKYERIAQEEIESVKETWDRLSRMESGELAPYDEDEECEFEDDEEEGSEEDLETRIYNDLTRRYNQAGDDAENGREGAGDSSDEDFPYINGPYVIDPEDFGDGNFDHDLYCLTYYSDGVLSNDWYEKLDIDETIGEDSLNHIGDKVEDVVHVRNERKNADYEVVRDPRRYADMITNDPLMQMHAN